MALIEGIGDEVLVFVALLVLAVLILIAWSTTRVRPMFSSGSVWMVHMQTAPERRVLEVYSLDERSTTTQQLTTGALNVEELSVDASDEHRERTSANVNTTSEESDDSVENQQAQTQQNNDQDRSVPNCENSASSEQSLRRRILDNTNSIEANIGCEPSVSSLERPVTVEESTSNPDTATIKLKFLDDTQRLVAAWLTQTVGEFKRQHFETDVSQGKVVRLIYRGQLLRDDSRSLASYGLHENCVLHCHVSTTPYEQAGIGRRTARPTIGGVYNNGQAENGLDLGRYIYVIFAFKFAILWSAWFVFPEYFSRTSLVSLILCSGLFMLFWYGSQRRRPVTEGLQNPMGHARAA